MNKVRAKVLKKELTPTSKGFFTTFDLKDAPWFPANSTITIRKYIESGRLKAVDISTNPALKRYRVPQAALLEYLENYGKSVSPKKKTAKIKATKK